MTGPLRHMYKIKKSLLALCLLMVFAVSFGTMSPAQVSAATQDDIDNAEVAALVTLVCEPQSDATRLQECTDSVRSGFRTCKALAARESATTPTRSEAILNDCVTRSDMINEAPNGKTVTSAQVLAAVEAGQAYAATVSAESDAEQQTCEDGDGEWVDGACTTGTADTPCSGGALGWILCPLAELATSVTNFFAGMIESLMLFSPLLASDQGAAIQAVWQLIVNIANILLVVAFLAVVFSQATSIGLTSYGIKKMLPKIIAAAVLMNISFYLCAVAVDVANIVGHSIAAVISVGIDTLPDPAAGTTAANVREGSSTGRNALVVILGVLIATPLFYTGAIYAVLPMLATAAVAIMTAFAVIIFRQVAIVLLIILSPLAFAAWVLPNTAVWFTRWRKLFIAMLAMFPLTMAIFYGSVFLSNVIIITMPTADDSVAPEGLMIQIMALAVLVLPLFALPFIMKSVGGILERFGAIVNNPQKGLIDRTRNKSQEWKGNNPYQRMKRDKKSERDHIRASDYAAKSGVAFEKRGASGVIARARYGVPITSKGREAQKEAFASAYDEAREDIGKSTERARGRLVDTGMFTAGSDYFDDAGNQIDKDKFMENAYIKGQSGTVKSQDGKSHRIDASDINVNRGIAAQAAKSGDKAMYGKLLTAAMETGNEELEFRLRDQGINNAGVVAGGHPDVVKGQYSASKSISADGLLAMDGSAVKRMGKYLSQRDNVYNDLIVGAKESARASLQAQVADPSNSRVSFTEAEVQAAADADLGRTGTDAVTKKGIYGKGRVTSYVDTAQSAFEEAVYQLNTKDIYSGKAVKGGDLDKSVIEAARTMGLSNAADIHFGNPTMQRTLNQAGNTAGAPTPPATPTITFQQQPLVMPPPPGAPARPPQPSVPVQPQQIITQVQQAGGWSKLSSKDVLDAYNHAQKFSNTNSPDTIQLSSEAIDELRNRGIMPPAPGP